MYEGVLLGITVNREHASFTALRGGAARILVYGQQITVDAAGVKLPLGEGMLA
ncbi:hypothetical protein D3C73_1649480 [compost metagenome]